MRQYLASLACACIALFALAPAATAEPYDAGHAVVDLVSERAVAIPGETVYLGLHLAMDDGWHVYWRNPGDAGLSPVIRWNETSALQGDIEGEAFTWPLPELLPVLPGEIMDYGYSGEVTLPFAYVVPADASGTLQLSGIADYLICKDVCIPETAPIAVNLDIGDTQVPNLADGARIAAAFNAEPAPLTGQATASLSNDQVTLSVRPDTIDLDDVTDARFLPFNNEIKHAQDQALSAGPDGLTLTMVAEPREPLGDRLDGVLTLTRSDGSRTGYVVEASNGAPLPGTSGRALAAGAGGGATLGFVTIIGFAILGGLILNLMPCVLPVLSIKAVGMVQAAASGQQSELRTHGLAYTGGVLTAFGALAAVFVALRATGDFVAVGFLLQYPAVVAVLALAAFALGLWLLGIFELGGSLQNIGSGAASRSGPTGAYMTGLLAATAGAPCVGPFMGASLGAVIARPAPDVFAAYLALGLGLALPFLLLSFAPGLHRFLPKPGIWMERLKQFFAFPMFLTAAALLFVLGAQVGTAAVAWVVIGAITIAFGIWVMKIAGGRLRPAAIATGFAALLLGLVLPVRATMAANTADAATAAYSSSEFETVAWSPEAVEAALASGQGVFVDFTATWCMICQANKRTTLNQAEVREAMGEAGIVFMVADFTSKDETIERELKAHGRPGVPMYLLYGPGQARPRLLPEALTPSIVLREIDAVLRETNQAALDKG